MTEEQRIFSGKLFASEVPELVAKKNKDFGPNTTIVTPLHPMLAEEEAGCRLPGQRGTVMLCQAHARYPGQFLCRRRSGPCNPDDYFRRNSPSSV